MSNELTGTVWILDARIVLACWWKLCAPPEDTVFRGVLEN